MRSNSTRSEGALGSGFHLEILLDCLKANAIYNNRSLLHKFSPMNVLLGNHTRANMLLHTHACACVGTHTHQIRNRHIDIDIDMDRATVTAFSCMRKVKVLQKARSESGCPVWLHTADPQQRSTCRRCSTKEGNPTKQQQGKTRTWKEDQDIGLSFGES